MISTILYEKSHKLNRLHSDSARSELCKDADLNMENQVCM